MNIETLEDVRRLSELCPPSHDNGIRSLGSMSAADGGYIPMYAYGGAIPRYGFGSWLKRHTNWAKGIGALLDVAKYAGFLLPGGPAISGAAAALKKKYIGDDVGLFDWKLGEGEEIGGDSWKDALLSGAKSAALTYLGGKALKGAHSSMAEKAVENATADAMARGLSETAAREWAEEMLIENFDPSAWGGLKSLFTGYEGALHDKYVAHMGKLGIKDSALAGLSGIGSSLMDPKNQFFTYPALSEIDRMQQAEEWKNQSEAMGPEYGFGDPSYQAAKDAAQADFDRMRGRGSSLYTYRRPVLPEVTALANLGVADGGYIPRLSNGGRPTDVVDPSRVVGSLDTWEQMIEAMGMAPVDGSDWLLGWANTLACGDPNCNRWGKGDEHLAYEWVNREAVNPGTGHEFWTSGLGGQSDCVYSGNCNIWTVLNQGQVPPGGWPRYFDEVTGSYGAPPAPPWLPNKGPELPTPGFRDPIMPHHEYRPGFHGEYQYFMPRQYDDEGEQVPYTEADPGQYGGNPYVPGTPEFVMWATPKTGWQAGPAGGGPPIGTHPQDVDMSMPPAYDESGNLLSNEEAEAAWLASLGSTDPMYTPPDDGIVPASNQGDLCPDGKAKDANGNCVAMPKKAEGGPMAPPGMGPPPTMAPPGMGPAMPQGEGVRGSLSQEEIGMALEQLSKAISEGDEAKLDMMFEYFGPELFQELINILMGEQRADASGFAANGGLLDDKGAGPRADDLLASVNGDPILLSGDEFVVNARATGELGPDNLQAINDSPEARRFVKSAMDSAGAGQMGMMA